MDIKSGFISRISTRISHRLQHYYYGYRRKEFLRQLSDIESTQRKRLKNIMSGLRSTQKWGALSYDLTYEQLRSEIPLSNYSNFKDDIERQRQTKQPILCDLVKRYEPTSGSTDLRKWIPYSAEFLREINSAASVWLGDLYHQFPKIKNGRHYWSLSWLPEDLRQYTNNDDSELFPVYQRILIQQTMAISSRVAQVSSNAAAWWATLVSLCACEDLSFISVWSPTFLLKMVEDIKAQWPQIQKALNEKRWVKNEDELNRVLGASPFRNVTLLETSDSNFIGRLWPMLALVSAWDSSSSAFWFDALKKVLPNVPMQGKGLWATEGVISIPFENKKILAIDSHFYEFMEIKSSKIVPAWQLELGCDYQPILWSSSGLLRYLMPDRIRVTGFAQATPCLEFIGRIRSIDMVGEKLDTEWVNDLFATNSHWRAQCMIACRQPKPHYVLVHQSQDDIDIELELLKFHHYKLARQIGQLGSARSIVPKELLNFLTQFGQRQFQGQNKIEVLFEVDHLQDLSVTNQGVYGNESN